MTGGRNECLAYAAPFGGPNRYVLQIGIDRGEPPGRRDRLVITGMNTASARVDLLRQLVRVGRFQFGQTAKFHDQSRQRIALRKFFQHIFRR